MEDGSKCLKLLIVEENDKDFKSISDCLKNILTWKFDIKRVIKHEDIFKELETKNYDVCLCDHDICNAVGSKLLSHSLEYTPIILLSSKDDCEAALLAFKAGALDCLVKDNLNEFNLERCILLATERINGLQHIANKGKQYQSLFDKSPDIVFLANDKQKITAINYAVKEILAFDEQACIGKSLLDFFSLPSDADRFLSALKEEGEINNYEATLLTAGAQTKICTISASIETNAQNNEYQQGTIRDISHSKKTERSYIRSEKLAASGRFITTLAHELRNPLNNIKLAVENLSQVSFTEEDAFFLNIIQRNGERINNLVTELLNSSKPTEVAFEDLSLHELLNNIIDNLDEKLKHQNVKLIRHFATVNPTIKGDAVKLTNAISNIFENALEAIEDNTGMIIITTLYKQDNITTYITDNGPGISDENKGKIFEPYFTSKRNGIGLGLTKTLNILQSHNAQIEVESNKNDGATFCIQFPS